MSEDKFQGLEKTIYLAVGAKVVLTNNLAVQARLANGSVGVVKDFLYKEGAKVRDLPKCVWVDFGDEYKGNPFFCNSPERKSWVPICPISFLEYTPKKS